MLDLLKLPASLRHLIEKRFAKERRQRVRRQADASANGDESTRAETGPPDGAERRSGAERRTTKRRTSD